MRYANFGFINLLWIILCGMVIFYIWVYKRRRNVLQRFAKEGLLETLTSSVNIRNRKIRLCLFGCAISLITFSLLRPQWGFHWEEVKRRGLDIIIAIDTSKSMIAEDVKPNRLERSKLAVKDLLKKLNGDRIGLIAFSGSAFLQCPLTVDYGGFLLSLDTLDVGVIPRGGTRISSAIQEAIKSYEGGLKKYKVLVLITDGEDHEGNAFKWAEKAKEEGIKIFCIGIGTKEGELIPVTGADGSKTFLKDREGKVVKSKLDDVTLQKIALTTGGSYVHATGAEFGLDLIYDEKLSKMEKRELKSKMSKQYEERYQWFLFAGLLLLLIEPFISEINQKEND